MAGRVERNGHGKRLANGAHVVSSLSHQSIGSPGGAWRLLPNEVGILKRAAATRGRDDDKTSSVDTV